MFVAVLPVSTPRNPPTKVRQSCSRWTPRRSMPAKRILQGHTKQAIFLDQLSRYLHLATNVNIGRDITRYVLGFLDGFEYRWFETLDKGRDDFSWIEFEAAFRDKFIPREYIQQTLDKYFAIKQTGTVW
jgi:hypothetical protein